MFTIILPDYKLRIKYYVRLYYKLRINSYVNYQL